MFGVAAGDPPPGELVPSVRDLAQRLLVNPNTVARAYQDLERLGILETKRGRGMEVTAGGPALCDARRREIVRGRLRDVLREAVGRRVDGGRCARTGRRGMDENERPGAPPRPGGPGMSGVISVRGLVKRYGSKTVVDRLDLEVPQGADLRLPRRQRGRQDIHHQGARRHASRRTAARPASSARTAGPGPFRLRHRVGYVAERPRFYEWMTVTEIGWFTASFHRAGFLDRYHDWAIGSASTRKKRLRDLSKGGYARVALALALAPDPEVLILDEPTSGLDLLTRRDFLASMVDLAANGRTILISSHGISELERIASHVGLLSHGKLLFSGPVDDIKRRFTRLQFRAADDPVVAGLGTVLHRQTLGRQLDLLIQDPTNDAAERLRAQEGVSDVEEAVPGLEDIYAAVMRNAGHAAPGVPI